MNNALRQVSLATFTAKYILHFGNAQGDRIRINN
jgi:hypothetical protein